MGRGNLKARVDGLKEIVPNAERGNALYSSCSPFLVLTERTENRKVPVDHYRTFPTICQPALVLPDGRSTKEPHEALRWKPLLFRQRLHPPRPLRALRQHRV